MGSVRWASATREREASQIIHAGASPKTRRDLKSILLFCPVAPACMPCPPSSRPRSRPRQEGKFSYTHHALLAPPLNPSAPWLEPGTGTGTGSLGPKLAPREEQPHLGMCCRHSCMCCGDSPSPLQVCRVSDWKSSPCPRPLRAQRMAGPAGDVRGANFLSWAEFSPTFHAPDNDSG